MFHNRQWGAEKKNQVLWFGDRYVGVDLENPSLADIAVAMGAKGVKVTDIDQVGAALQQGIKDQMENGKTTIIEMITRRAISSQNSHLQNMWEQMACQEPPQRPFKITSLL